MDKPKYCLVDGEPVDSGLRERKCNCVNCREARGELGGFIPKKGDTEGFWRESE